MGSEESERVEVMYRAWWLKGKEGGMGKEKRSSGEVEMEEKEIGNCERGHSTAQHRTAQLLNPFISWFACKWPQ